MYYKKDNHFDCKDKTGGYTLIEVLIAIAIFSIGIMGVGNMQLRSTGGNTNARIGTEASVWAMDRVETLMLLPYTHADLNLGAHQVIQGLYTVNWTVYDNTTGATPAGYPLWGVTPAVNTKIIHVTVAGPKGTFRTNPSTLKFTRGANY
jgi:prepilin-type N-terminal cleavage/methylation domain-containing protein